MKLPDPAAARLVVNPHVERVAQTPPAPPPAADPLTVDDVESLLADLGFLDTSPEPDVSPSSSILDAPGLDVPGREDLLAAKFDEAADPQADRWLRDPVAWVKERLNGYLWSKQRDILHALNEHDKVAVHTCHNIGKALALDTPLPTPTGWTTMGDVRVGDVLLDESGKPCAVTGVSPTWMRDTYRVVFRDGTSVTCSGEHEWNVLTRDARRSGGRDWRDHWALTTTVETADLVMKHGQNPMIPATRPLQGEWVNFIMDPYTLGVWLGDGARGGGSFCGHVDDIDEVLAIVHHAEETTERECRGSVRALTIVNGRVRLRAMGVLNKKFIPHEYLRGSYEQRLELLRGLMDTDGSCASTGLCSFGVKDKRLADDVYELVSSLGIVAYRRERRATLYGKDCGPFYTMTFATHERVFHLKRKAERQRCASRSTGRTIVRVEHVETVPTRCVEVDSPSHLYLATKSFIPTHNSHLAALAACWWIDVHPPGSAFILTTAPTGAQVKAILWRYINRFHAQHQLPGRMNLTEWFIGNEMVGLGRKPSDYTPDAFQGIHAEYVLAVIDEACGVDQDLWDQISTMTSNEGSRTLAIGNPDDPNSYFKQVCSPGSGWNVIGVSAQDTPNLTGEEVPSEISRSLISNKWVEDRKLAWGTDSPIYISKVEGKFPVDSEDGVIPASFIVPCRTLAEDTSLGSAPVALGVDVGDTTDRTVVAERHGQRAGKMHIVNHGSDAMNAVGQIVRIINDTKAESLVIDVVGLGWGVYGRLKELSRFHNSTSPETTHSARIIRFSAGETAHNAEKFYNKRAELWWEIGRELSRTKQWDLTAMSDDIVAELTTPRYSLDGSKGRIIVEAKKDIRKRIGRSPDIADALLMSFYEGEPPPPPARFPDANRQLAQMSLLDDGSAYTGIAGPR